MNNKKYPEKTLTLEERKDILNDDKLLRMYCVEMASNAFNGCNMPPTADPVEDVINYFYNFITKGSIRSSV